MPDRTAPGPSDSPATLLGPISLALGCAALLGPVCLALGFTDAEWPIALALLLLPVTLFGGILAITLGLPGLHYAQRGIGRMWPAATGTALGAAAFVLPCLLLVLAY
ncbi:hypothetical protein [Streptomyces sp. NPDC093018]|uniref:hypothetical protein n=1 Tax=Streptomyces sp. NPDC093018 TaxID=3155067 RepID=UPI00341F91F5